jgi:dolichol kinase
VPNNPSRLTLAELGRKGYHLLGLLIPLLYLLTDVERITALIATGALWIVAVVFDILRFSIPAFNAFSLKLMRGFLRKGETFKPNGMVYYILACFLVILLWNRTTACISLIVLVAGDAMAAIIGLAWGRHKIWGGKSLEGSLACLVTVWLVGLLFLAPDRSLLIAVVATLVESLPTTVILNDNLWIPLATSATLALSYQLW